MWRELLARRAPTSVSVGRDVLAQRLEGAQQHGQPLALDRLADEQDPQRPLAVGAARERAARGQRPRVDRCDPVGDDPVVAAEEAPRGPRGGLGDGDADVQAVDAAAGRRAGCRRRW